MAADPESSDEEVPTSEQDRGRFVKRHKSEHWDAKQAARGPADDAYSGGTAPPQGELMAELMPRGQAPRGPERTYYPSSYRGAG